MDSNNIHNNWQEYFSTQPEVNESDKLHINLAIHELEG
jgi:hypothetical protein